MNTLIIFPGDSKFQVSTSISQLGELEYISYFGEEPVLYLVMHVFEEKAVNLDALRVCMKKIQLLYSHYRIPCRNSLKLNIERYVPDNVYLDDNWAWCDFGSTRP